MVFRVDITDRAQLDIDDLARYCRNYSVAFWEEQEARLARVFETWLATTPHMWVFFFLTGAPYHAYLFVIGDRTKYWIVYTIDNKARIVTSCVFGTHLKILSSFEHDFPERWLCPIIFCSGSSGKCVGRNRILAPLTQTVLQVLADKRRNKAIAPCALRYNLPQTKWRAPWVGRGAGTMVEQTNGLSWCRTHA